MGLSNPATGTFTGQRFYGRTNSCIFGGTDYGCATVFRITPGGKLTSLCNKVRPHAWYQSAVVLLNFVIILLVMIPSFRVHVSPKLPAKVGKAYYSLALAHATLGGSPEIAAL